MPTPLDIPAVLHYYMWTQGNGFKAALVATEDTEYDVRQVSRWKWYASDDHGTRHYGRTLNLAIRKAISHA